MTHDPTGFETPRAGRRAALAVVAAGTALALGLAGGWLFRGPETVEVPRAPTSDELAAACAPQVEPVKDELATAQEKVAELERDAATKEARVRELETKIARGAEAGKALRAELANVKAELAATKQALEIAVREKDVLLADLRETKQELETTKEELVVTKEQRDFAREDALYNRWQTFLHGAELEICDKGNRKRLGDCRESVMATLSVDGRRDRFAHCIRSGQATPMVHELAKEAALPQFAEMLDEETKQVQGWYVDFCDPTLPERTDAPLAEGHLPRTDAAAG